jgi:hypothetical protein
MALSEVKALTFDVFGTVVDYRGTIIREGELFNQAKGLQVDWAQFADACLPMPGALALVPRWLVSCRQDGPGPIWMPYTAWLWMSC